MKNVFASLRHAAYFAAAALAVLAIGYHFGWDMPDPAGGDVALSAVHHQAVASK